MKQEARPPLSLSLVPGVYVVIVDAPGAAPAQLQMVIEELPAGSDRAPTPR
jgi:hypothetical protein